MTQTAPLTARKIRIQHVSPSKYVSEGAADLIFSPDVGNNRVIHTHKENRTNKFRNEVVCNKMDGHGESTELLTLCRKGFVGTRASRRSCSRNLLRCDSVSDPEASVGLFYEL